MPHVDGHHVCRSSHGDFTLPGAEAHYPPDLALEPIHLEIRYRVDIANDTVTGSVTHTVVSKTDGPTRLVLHAMDFAEVSATDTDARGLSCDYDGREITLDWDDAFSAGEERRVQITVRIEKPSTGMFISYPTDAFPEKAWYAATDNETERARHWLPTIDLPSVRPTLDFHLTAEERFTILANGALQSETTDGGWKTAHWKLEQPCPSYLTCIAIGDFVKHDDGEFQGIPVASFTSKKFTEADLERSFGRTRDMLAWMVEKLGHPFPYPKYYQFALPGFGGAMENISLVAWDDQFVLDETLAKEWTWLVDQINAHEMAHSYFGDMITCRDFAHAWLKESWATYMETLWLEDNRGADEGDYDVFVNVARYIDEADNAYKRPIVTRQFNHSWQMYDRHLYPGGGSRLHMLRKHLGDDVFFRGVREYVNRFAFKKVETADFRRTHEEVSGRSLVKWFDQWIHGKGYPHLAAKFEYDKKSKEATFTVEQKQEDKKQGVPLFEMDLDLGWTVDGESHVETISLDGAKHVFVVKMYAEPDYVRIDPNNRIVAKVDFDPGAKKLMKQLTDAPDVPGRIRAAQTLLKGGKRKAVDAVVARYADEPFWGARLEFAKSLSGAGTQYALDALAELVGSENDGMVLETLLRALAKHRDAGLRTAVEARLDAGLPLYRATQAAYETLGAQRGDAPLDRLLDAASQDGDAYGVQRSGAFRALASSRAKDALEPLLAAVQPGGASNRARPAACHALGALGRMLSRNARTPVREALEDRLRDPIDRVRIAAVVGLRMLGEPAAIPALEAFKAGESDQEQPFVNRAVAAIRAAAKSESPAASEKEIGELREQLRKLGEEVEKLSAKVEADAKNADPT